MENNIDKYSHKLSVKNNISYEVARHELERKINKLEDKNVHSNNMAKTAYKDIRFNMNGGKIKTYKITYNL
tara:strand:+ start:129 stop:341 length:213 start_codon:yes stop_codon:yes gene_type:complete